jgi:DNA-directed RNA polymerase subunit RPC12/RpoP
MGSGWIVEHRCTQCGAPITLEETDRFFTCPFCRVKICLTTKDHFRYYLLPPESSVEDMFFVPYWRVRGMIFACDEELEVKSSIIDATHCGFGAGIYPESLGLRPQALKLRFATPESGKLFPEPSLTFQGAFTKIEGGLPQGRQRNAPVRFFYRTFMGEKVSIV